jgi:hypothetical protein
VLIILAQYNKRGKDNCSSRQVTLSTKAQE